MSMLFGSMIEWMRWRCDRLWWKLQNGWDEVFGRDVRLTDNIVLFRESPFYTFSSFADSSLDQQWPPVTHVPRWFCFDPQGPPNDSRDSHANMILDDEFLWPQKQRFVCQHESMQRSAWQHDGMVSFDLSGFLHDLRPLPLMHWWFPCQHDSLTWLWRLRCYWFTICD